MITAQCAHDDCCPSHRRWPEFGHEVCSGVLKSGDPCDCTCHGFGQLVLW